jgi:protoporphyrinogen oxidase
MLGYIDGSFLELTRALAVSAERRGARIHLGTAIEGIDRIRDRVHGVRVGDRTRRADAVVATVGLPILRRLLPEHADWIRIPQIQYRGALVLLLQLDEKLSRYYWTNVADAEIPFPVLVEHTNLIGPERYGGARLLYAGSYLDPGHEFFELSADRLLATYAPAIRRVFPGFRTRQVKDLWLSADRVAQPVITAGYQRQRPPFATNLEGLYICNTSQIYPEDRGTNYNVRLAQECALEIAAALQRPGGRLPG